MEISLIRPKKVFASGKLAKYTVETKEKNIKRISIPIKYGNDVAYVLEIIEESERKGDVLAFLGYFLNSEKNACFITDRKNNLIISNKEFEKSFKKTDVLRDFMMHNLRDNKFFFAELKKLVRMNYLLTKKVLKSKGELTGYLYTFKKISKKGGKR